MPIWLSLTYRKGDTVGIIRSQWFYVIVWLSKKACAKYDACICSEVNSLVLTIDVLLFFQT